MTGSPILPLNNGTKIPALDTGLRTGPDPDVTTAMSYIAIQEKLNGSNVRVISEGLRQEVKPFNIRSTVISPGAVATELTQTITDPVVAEGMQKNYQNAIPADSFGRMVAFAISQPDDVDVNEILFRPTSQVF